MASYDGKKTSTPKAKRLSQARIIFRSAQQLQHVIRAWKDEEYRNSLSCEELEKLPKNPAGLIDLTENELNTILKGGVDLSGCGEGDSSGCTILGISTALSCISWETVGCTAFQPGCD